LHFTKEHRGPCGADAVDLLQQPGGDRRVIAGLVGETAQVSRIPVEHQSCRVAELSGGALVVAAVPGTAERGDPDGSR
jgi:hypothetical protein